MDNVNLAEARAHLSRYVARAIAGDPVCITQQGKPVVLLSAILPPRKPIDIAGLQALTESMTDPGQSARTLMPEIRGDERY